MADPLAVIRVAQEPRAHRPMEGRTIDGVFREVALTCVREHLASIVLRGGDVIIVRPRRAADKGEGAMPQGMQLWLASTHISVEGRARLMLAASPRAALRVCW